MSQKLSQNLKAAGKATLVFDSPDGKSADAPYGGRVLGLFTPGSSRISTGQPALSSVKSAKAFQSSQWQNTGGTGSLAPEISFSEFFETGQILRPVV